MKEEAKTSGGAMCFVKGVFMRVESCADETRYQWIGSFERPHSGMIQKHK